MLECQREQAFHTRHVDGRVGPPGRLIKSPSARPGEVVRVAPGVVNSDPAGNFEIPPVAVARERMAQKAQAKPVASKAREEQVREIRR